jgi:hypothetical protein
MHFLDFEKPIAELEGKIEELRHLSDTGDLNIAEEVTRLQTKVDRLLRQTYSKLSAWQKTQVARHPERPHFSNYVAALVEDFTPLAGDRLYAEDRAIIGGLARFGLSQGPAADEPGRSLQGPGGDPGRYPRGLPGCRRRRARPGRGHRVLHRRLPAAQRAPDLGGHRRGRIGRRHRLGVGQPDTCWNTPSIR